MPASYSSRLFAGRSDLDWMIAFARDALRARSPGATYWHPGDVVWQVFPETAVAAESQDIRLWFDGGALAGFAIFEPPLNFRFDVRADIAVDGPLVAAILEWGEERRQALMAAGAGTTPVAYTMLGERTVATTALESDRTRIAMLERCGYARHDRHSTCYARSLDVPVPDPRLPDGVRVRHATDADLDARIDLHRDAWSVWGPSSATVEAYRRLRGARLYDQELDVVVEAHDGTLVSYCIAWADAATRVATFEPVGTRPQYAGRGLGREVIFEAFRRLRGRGIHTALVGTASVNERAMRLYASCSFERIDVDRYCVKDLGEA